MAYNRTYNITPRSIQKGIRAPLQATLASEEAASYQTMTSERAKAMGKKEKASFIKTLEKEMKEAARELNFEKAAEIRDIIFDISQK